MKYKDELSILCRKYPSDFICEEDVLAYLLFTSSPYQWRDGQLVRSPVEPEYIKQNICTQEEVIRANAAAREKRMTSYDLDVSRTWKDKRNYRWTKLKSGSLVTNYRVPSWRDTPLTTIPDDIQDDWLDAVKKACKIARQIYPKAPNTRCARMVEARIKSILAARRAKEITHETTRWRSGLPALASRLQDSLHLHSWQPPNHH